MKFVFTPEDAEPIEVDADGIQDLITTFLDVMSNDLQIFHPAGFKMTVERLS
jgi:hypothetical protein